MTFFNILKQKSINQSKKTFFLILNSLKVENTFFRDKQRYLDEDSEYLIMYLYHHFFTEIGFYRCKEKKEIKEPSKWINFANELFDITTEIKE